MMAMVPKSLTFVLMSLHFTSGSCPPFYPSSSRPSFLKEAIESIHNEKNGRSNIHFRSRGWTASNSPTALVLFQRGGGDSIVAPDSPVEQESATNDRSLDDRVMAAMRRLGLGDGDDTLDSSGNKRPEHSGGNCEGGVCTLENLEADINGSENVSDNGVAGEDEKERVPDEATSSEKLQEDIYSTADRISSELNVPTQLALAAIGASYSNEGGKHVINEEAARLIVQAEVDAIQNVPDDCDEVKQLVSEGFDIFYTRRSLAFSGMNVDDARAILIADAEDEEAERQEIERAQAEASEKLEEEKAEKLKEMKTVTVESNFDPVASMAEETAKQQQQRQQQQQNKPTPAKKEDVVFEGTTEDLQKLVIESPVPVLLDVYADWCGPCKQLTPILEQICVNAGGMLRLVKINTDQQRQISSALEVKALPTVFGIKDGKVLHMFQGLPRDEESMRSFLMGMMIPNQPFKPPVTAEEKSNYENLSAKLLKLAAGASFSFSARERLQNKIAKSLDDLVCTIGGETGMAAADDSARILRSLLSNVIRSPFEAKFRRVKLDNKVIASKVAQYAPCLFILKSIGFVEEGSSSLIVGKGKKVVNIAPFVVARDCIDKWIDKNRYEIAAAARKRSDEIERARLAAEAEEAAKNKVDDDDYDEDDKEDSVDRDLCIIKLRMEGKKKVHDIEMNVNDPLNVLLERLPFAVMDGETVQLTCAAKRLIVKSTDREAMKKTLAQHRLMPSASIVVKLGDGNAAEVVSGKLAERASAQKKKTGSHSMHSIGLYAKDDGNKGELFDGGGGVLYEHDISDDEEPMAEEEQIPGEESIADESNMENKNEDEAEED